MARRFLELDLSKGGGKGTVRETLEGLFDGLGE